MLAIIACMFGVLAILVTAEILWHHKILIGENERKFVHILVGTFAAFWPWFISWEAVQLIGSVMLIATLLNRHRLTFNYSAGLRKNGYGDILLALAIVMCATLTREPLFFTLAILHLSLADGFAAVVGVNFGKYWNYKIFKQAKTVLGTMAFWFVSLCILSVGTLFAYDLISFPNYLLLILLLPPLLTLVENISIRGFDNIMVPMVALLALTIAQA